MHPGPEPCALSAGPLCRPGKELCVYSFWGVYSGFLFQTCETAARSLALNPVLKALDLCANQVWPCGSTICQVDLPRRIGPGPREITQCLALMPVLEVLGLCANQGLPCMSAFFRGFQLRSCGGWGVPGPSRRSWCMVDCGCFVNGLGTSLSVPAWCS